MTSPKQQQKAPYKPAEEHLINQHKRMAMGCPIPNGTVGNKKGK